jgi:hypothetical protein
MPIHDWTKVTPGTFHDFHSAWIAELRKVLNGGVLPRGYYAMAEQVAGQIVPDVLALEVGPPDTEPSVDPDQPGGLAIAVAPPRVSLRRVTDESGVLLAKQKHLIIRHASGDRVVAFIEIVSPANKDGEPRVRSFVQKAHAAIGQGCHLLVLDLFPPGPADHSGMHGAIWRGYEGEGYKPPPGKPLTLAAYRADVEMGPECFVEPTAVGTPLIDMPLFFTPERYVNVPLEPTYAAAYAGVPERWRRVIEA